MPSQRTLISPWELSRGTILGLLHESTVDEPTDVSSNRIAPHSLRVDHKMHGTYALCGWERCHRDARIILRPPTPCRFMSDGFFVPCKRSSVNHARSHFRLARMALRHALQLVSKHATALRVMPCHASFVRCAGGNLSHTSRRIGGFFWTIDRRGKPTMVPPRSNVLVGDRPVHRPRRWAGWKGTVSGSVPIKRSGLEGNRSGFVVVRTGVCVSHDV